MDEYAAWPAAAELRGLVERCYQVHVRAAASPVLPDARAGLVWLSDGTLRACGPDSRAWTPRRPGLRVVGVRIALGAAPIVFGVPARILTDRNVPLERLWGSAAVELAELLDGAAEPRAQAALLQGAVGARAGGAMPDRLTRHIAARLSRDTVRTRALAAEVGLSERQLRRRCETAFGYPPSELARLCRLHRFLALVRQEPAGTTLATLAAAAGYADQAHLSRDSRALLGRRPSLLRAGLASDSFKPTGGARSYCPAVSIPAGRGDP